MNRIMEWLRPPQFDDPILNLQAENLLNGQVISVFAALGIGLVGIIFQTYATMIAVAMVLPLIVFSIFMTRAGWLNSAAILLVCSSTVAITYTLVATREGIHTVSVLFFPTTIILAARVLPWRTLILATAIMILAVGGVAYMEYTGMITTLYSQYKPKAVYEDVFIIALGLIAAMVSMRVIINRMTNTLRQSQESEKALVEKNRQLEREISSRRRAEAEILSLNARLEERVNARTAELQQALMELESFSYTISHDLRAPLRAVDGLAGIILQENSGKLDDATVEKLNRIKSNGKHMGVLIDGLLEFLRLGRAELQKRDISPKMLAYDVIEKLIPEYKGREVLFDVADLPNCKADGDLLKQVLDRLLHNAIKFTRKKSDAKIQVGYFKQSIPTIYYVRDNGAGFDMKHADKLFGVFQKLHSPDEYEGTGLSLALVQRIIHLHGGKIWAEGEVGKGATFYFTLQ